MRKSTWIWLILLTAFTLLPAILLLATLSWCNCDDFYPLWEPAATVLIIIWFVGSSIILFVAGAKQRRKPEDSSPCPQSGRAVTLGLPTCFACGYNLLRSGR